MFLNLNELNEKQMQAVNCINGPLLIVAGAGSGKTSVIVSRILNLLHHNVKEREILTLTFTNKACLEMKERLSHISGKKLKQLDVFTFHSFGVDFLKKNIERLSYKKNFSIYDSHDQQLLLKNTLREMGEDPLKYNLFELLTMFSDIKTSRITWEDLEDGSSIEFYKFLYSEYQDYLKTCNALDFDDLIKIPSDILNSMGDVLKEYEERYKYILVDEFQDTSGDQYELIKTLSKKNRNICVVGDDDQSIYSWRGANYKNIDSFEKDFPELIEIKLEQNYRSSKNILNLANSLIVNNKNRKEKSLWSSKDQVNPVRVHASENEFEEAEFVSSSIKELLIAKKDFLYSDVAVLTRTNKFMRNIEESFLQNRIPYFISGGFSFFERSEIKDVIAYLKFIMNPKDDASLLRIINKPKRSIGKQTLKKIVELAKEHKEAIIFALEEIEGNNNENNYIKGAAHISITELLDIQRRYRSRLSSNKNLAHTLRSFLKEIEYFYYLDMEYGMKNKNVSKYKRENVNKFVEFLERYETDRGEEVDIYNYLNNVTLKAYSKDYENKNNKVSILTIHSAKGLEFENVFIIGVEDGIIPHMKSISEDDKNASFNLEEERRLFYVAITRAKENLVLSYTKKRKIMGEEKDMQPSIFIDELDKTNFSVEDNENYNSRLTEESYENLFERMKQMLSK